MSIRLHTGLLKTNAAWTSVMEQTGLAWEKTDFRKDLNREYGVIIINKTPDTTEAGQLAEYLQSGGAVLEVYDNLLPDTSGSVSFRKVKTLINRPVHGAFMHIPYADIYGTAGLHADGKVLEGMIHVSTVQDKGLKAYFGADISALIQQEAYSRKRYYNPIGGNPDELVSTVSKENLSDAFISLLRSLYVERGLPFVRKWTSPYKEPVCAFRIDSDFGDQESIRTLAEAADAEGMKMTWFLHVKAHEDWLNEFHKLQEQGHEIALHGYRHVTGTDSEKVQANMQKGLDLLQKQNFRPTGFCAPYGIYNEALKKALKHFEFMYSSEFTFTADGVPVRPVDSELPLQIPVHPICTGSLNRQHLSEHEMTAYFGSVIRNKAARKEPVLLYHHPLQPGLMAFRKAMQKLTALSYRNITFGEFAEFWNNRNNAEFTARTDGNTLITEAEKTENQWLQVSQDSQKYDIIPLGNNRTELTGNAPFEYSAAHHPSGDEIEALRKKDLKLLKTNILDWKNRNRI